MIKLSVEKRYHPEYGGYVYQPVVYKVGGDYLPFIEPFVEEAEAQAYLKGVKYALANLDKPECDSCLDNVLEDCHDCEQYQEYQAKLEAIGRG